MKLNHTTNKRIMGTFANSVFHIIHASGVSARDFDGKTGRSLDFNLIGVIPSFRKTTFTEKYL